MRELLPADTSQSARIMAYGVRAAAIAVTPTDQKFGIATHIHASYGAQWRVFENVRPYLE